MNPKLLFFNLIFFFAFSELYAQIYGCTDPNANNFSPGATQNNGSCTYDPTFFNPVVFLNLSSQLEETSGLIFYSGGLWSHNDSGGEPEIYKIDTISGQIIQTISVNNATNIDWEDLSQDENYIYIGDFGNNSGNRQDLKIYRINKEDIPSSGNANINSEIIEFEYSDQHDFTAAFQNNNFDCEAMICIADSIYFFSKNWANSKTKLYALPKTPGNFIAKLRDSFNAEGLITGADINLIKNEITLSGYKNQVWIPFVWLLFDYDGNDFFSGNKRRIELPYIISSQTEGICYYNEKKTFISAEKTQTFPQRIFKLNTGIWTNIPYTGIEHIASDDIDFEIIPNPVNGKKFKVKIDDLPYDDYSFEIFDSIGRKIYIKNYSFKAKNNKLKIKFKTNEFSKGIYFIRLYSGKIYTVKKLIIN
ncbi:MAG: T9SS type A sorting domain-containing protein [Bacteroidales bacterium]|nr:T9SS type A sorting domain-containing protein [Bacteroidales bacterium]